MVTLKLLQHNARYTWSCLQKCYLFNMNPANLFLFKVNNKKRVWNMFTVNNKRRHWHRSSVFILNLELFSHLILVLQLVTLTRTNKVKKKSQFRYALISLSLHPQDTSGRACSILVLKLLKIHRTIEKLKSYQNHTFHLILTLFKRSSRRDRSYKNSSPVVSPLIWEKDICWRS